MGVEVVAYRPEWSGQFEVLAASLRSALAEVPVESIEHVGSTSVPGLTAKPVLEVDVIVDEDHLAEAIRALERCGYRHRGDLGVSGREAFTAPDDAPRRHVYVCRSGSLAVRNHLAVREVLRARADLAAEYGAVKLALASDPSVDVDTYGALKSVVLQRVLAQSDLSASELEAILELNDPAARAASATGR